MTAVEIVEEIMTQHWDPKACRCWVCCEGRNAGCHPKSAYMPHITGSTHGRVWVDPAIKRPKTW